MKKIAVLITCHNRKEKTITCLESFHRAIINHEAKIMFDVYIVDDGSTDGTSEEIFKHFPETNIINGSGKLYWAGGMRLAWETALIKNPDYDFFLLLNDDVILNDNFLDVQLSTHQYCINKFGRSGIYVSSTRDLNNSSISYGGTLIKQKGIKVKTARINPSNIPEPCSMANANILMVPLPIVKAIGILDSRYIHQFADYDYSLLASKQGFPILVCPGYGGNCKNDHGKDWLSSKSSLSDRINYLYSPLGLAYKEQLYYLRKNFKYQLPYYFIMLWLKTLFPIVWDILRVNSQKINTYSI